MRDPQLFLMRVWQHRGQFQASLRGVDGQEPRFFSAPDQLTAYLADVVRPEAESSPSPATNAGESA